MPKTTYLDVNEVAALFGVSRRTVYRWLRDGIPNTTDPFPYCQVGRKVRWTPEQVADVKASFERTGFVPSRRGPRRPRKAAA